MNAGLEVIREDIEPLAVGASELGAVMGCDPWTTPLQLYRRKRGLDPAVADNDRMRIGRLLEGPVVDLARGVIPVPIRRNRRTWAHPVAPLFATPDAFVGRDRLLEVKVVGIRGAQDWEDAIPCRVRFQVQGQLAVTGRDAAYVGALVGTELRLTLVEADEVMQLELLHAATAFMELHVDPGIPPDPLTYEERWAALLEQTGELEEVEALAGGPAQEAGERLLEIREIVDRYDDETRELRLDLLEAMIAAGATRLRGSGWSASCSQRAGSVDWRAVAAELEVPPELVEAHRSPPSTTFTVRSSRHD